MNRNDLRRLNLNLLVVFEALMRQRSVTLAAESLFLGQPAVSSALAQLRQLFADPLFVRVGNAMEPTPRSLELVKLLEPALNSISTAVSPVSEFDPASSQAVFRVGLTDDVEFALFPQLLKRIRAEAPGVVLVVRRANYLSMSKLLIDGEISVGVGYTRDLPASAKRKVLRRARTLVMRADQHPDALSLDEFCARPQALVSFAGGVMGFVDEALRTLGRQRQVVLVVPQFNGLGALLQGTDLLAAVPEYAAEVFIANGGIRAEPMPFALDPFELHMVWQSAKDREPGERWLRSIIQLHLGTDQALA